MADIVRRMPTLLRRHFDWPFHRLFEDCFPTFADERASLPELRAEGQFALAIDVSEDENAVTLTAEVPGIGKEDLEVTLDNGVLTLRGEKKEQETTEGVNYHRVERRYGHFERRMRLPEYVDPEKVEATCNDGVLKLRIPKAEAAKAKAIQIK